MRSVFLFGSYSSARGLRLPAGAPKKYPSGPGEGRPDGQAQLEERLILGPGWITRFENGETVPSIDMMLAILHETGAELR